MLVWYCLHSLETWHQCYQQQCWGGEEQWSGVVGCQAACGRQSPQRSGSICHSWPSLHVRGCRSHHKYNGEGTGYCSYMFWLLYCWNLGSHRSSIYIVLMLVWNNKISQKLTKVQSCTGIKVQMQIGWICWTGVKSTGNVIWSNNSCCSDVWVLLIIGASPTLIVTTASTREIMIWMYVCMYVCMYHLPRVCAPWFPGSVYVLKCSVYFSILTCSLAWFTNALDWKKRTEQQGLLMSAMIFIDKDR